MWKQTSAKIANTTMCNRDILGVLGSMKQKMLRCVVEQI